MDKVKRCWQHNLTCKCRGYHNKDGGHTYTEADFHACLLVHGWRHDVVNPGFYWATIDLWFKDAWPERYINEQPMVDHSGQMEFKLQFFDWVRMFKPATHVFAAHEKYKTELTQLCKKGYMGGEA